MKPDSVANEIAEACGLNSASELEIALTTTECPIVLLSAFSALEKNSRRSLPLELLESIDSLDDLVGWWSSLRPGGIEC